MDVRPEARHSEPPMQQGGVSSNPAKTTYIDTQRAAPNRVVGVLVCTDGKLLGEIYGLRDGENKLGRDPACQVRFSERDGRISRMHAQIVHDGGYFTIEPLNQDNPTRLNEEVIQERVALDDRAVIYLGRSEFAFRTI
jgi:hypothetical protein